MPSFELSDEIQLSGSLCSLQDWGGDEGRGEIGGLGEKQGQGKHCLLVRYEEPHRALYTRLLNACLL